MKLALKLFLIICLLACSSLAQTRVVVNLVNFQDDLREPFTVETATQTMATVSAFYQENSFGAVSFVTEVRPWRTLNINKTCDDAAIKAAAGAEPDGKTIYAFPWNTDCAWTGRGRIDGTVYLNGTLQPFATAHELGHTYGLGHSSGLDCGALIICDPGTVYGQGDVFDVMGANLFHFNAYQKEELGWLVVSEVQSGFYHIPSYGAIKIFRTEGGIYPDIYYYIEYRNPVGFDAPLVQWGVQNGVMLRLGYRPTGGSYLLDATPETGIFNDGVLTGSFTDGPITISVLSIDSTGANVQINAQPTPTPTPVCKKFNPQGKCIKWA